VVLGAAVIACQQGKDTRTAAARATTPWSAAVGSPARCAATIAWTAAPASARWAEDYAFGFRRAYAIDLRLRVPTRWRPFLRRDAV